MSAWPIHEGFFRYAYVIARKQKCEEVLAACESSREFQRHYLNNLSLLSADIQSPDDVRRVEAILNDGSIQRSDLRGVAWLLFRKRETSEYLNIQILRDHVGKLDDEESARFMRAMFSPSDIHDSDWRDRVSELLGSFLGLEEEEKLGVGVPALALALHFVPHARWEVREATLNGFTALLHHKVIRDAVEICGDAASASVRNCVKEVTEGQMLA